MVNFQDFLSRMVGIRHVMAGKFGKKIKQDGLLIRQLRVSYFGHGLGYIESTIFSDNL